MATYQHYQRFGLALLGSLILHGVLVLYPALAGSSRDNSASVIQFQIVQQKPPPSRYAAVSPRPAPKKQPAHYSLKVAVPEGPPRPAPRRAPHAATSKEKITVEPPAQKSFGVTADTVTSGAAGLSVPVGDRLDMAPHNSRPKKVAIKTPRFMQQDSPVPARILVFPRVLQEYKAAYPQAARQLGIEGKVVMRVLVDPSGRVTQVQVQSGPGYGLDEAAQRALQRFRFSPARDAQGRAHSRWITYGYTFRLED